MMVFTINLPLILILRFPNLIRTILCLLTRPKATTWTAQTGSRSGKYARRGPERRQRFPAAGQAANAPDLHGPQTLLGLAGEHPQQRSEGVRRVSSARVMA